MSRIKSKIGLSLFWFQIFVSLFYSAQSQNYDKQNDNQIGSVAVNFSYMIDSESQTLYELIENKETNILVLFHSPDCELCAKTKKRLAKSKKINKLLDQGDLTLLAVAVETDKAKWEESCKNLPDNWVNAYCEDCETIIRSYIWTVPTLFLIGSDSKIIDREFKHNEKNNYNKRSEP